MVAVAARETESFVRSGFSSFPIILLYGPDEGLVSERAAAIASATTAGDKGNILRMDGDDIASDPFRLADEANAISMFGGVRAIRVRLGAKSVAAGLEPLLAQPPIDARVIIEAGDLKPNHALRQMLEKSRSAAASPCYPEDARDLARLIDESLSQSGLSIAPDARSMLIGLLGEDRRRSRGEIDKLVLYCAGRTSITMEDVLAIVSDAAPQSVDQVIDASFLGELDLIEREARRAFADGQDAAVMLGFALRQAFLLQALSRKGGDDRSGAESARQVRVGWKREKAIAAQVAKWTSARLDRAVQILADAVLAARRQPMLAEAIAIRALWSLALAVSRR